MPSLAQKANLDIAKYPEEVERNSLQAVARKQAAAHMPAAAACRLAVPVPDRRHRTVERPWEDIARVELVVVLPPS